MAQQVGNLLAVQETRLDPWVGKIPLKEAMATHSSILCLENFMDREAWQATVHGVIQTSTNAT